MTELDLRAHIDLQADCGRGPYRALCRRARDGDSAALSEMASAWDRSAIPGAAGRAALLREMAGKAVARHAAYCRDMSRLAAEAGYPEASIGWAAEAGLSQGAVEVPSPKAPGTAGAFGEGT